MSEGGRKGAEEVKYLKLLIATLALACSSAQALQIPSIHVFSEANDNDSRECSYDNLAAVAAVESVFRQNRIPVKKDSPYSAYISVNLFKQSGSSLCIANIYFQVGVYVSAIPPNSKQSIFSLMELCSRAKLITRQVSNVQSTVNDNLRSYSEICISEIEKK
jgi:hypothetical protein